MVGNDVTEDMCVKDLGLDTYLITDCILNSKNLPIEEYKSGSFHDFEKFIDRFPVVE